MSIMPLEPQQPREPDPQDAERQIIRRWLWRQCLNLLRAATFIVLGVVIGLFYAAQPPGPRGQIEPSAALQTCETQRANAVKTFELLQEKLRAIEQERQTYFTMLYEPGHSEQLAIGGLALLFGLPGGLGEMAKGLAPPEMAWVLPGKQTPLRGRATAQYVWWDRTAKQKSGPFKPEPFPQAAQR